MRTLHLMTQRDQPYGSVRKCCEQCGLMMVARPDDFWLSHAWTDDPKEYEACEPKEYEAPEHGSIYRRCMLVPSAPANT